jgi:hypothetical protein
MIAGGTCKRMKKTFLIAELLKIQIIKQNSEQ